MAYQVITIETQIPADVYKTLQAHGVFRSALVEQSQQLLALRFYQKRVLSLGKAALLAGMSRWQFIEYLSENEVPVIDFTEDELAAEFAAVDQLQIEIGQ